MKLIEKQIIRHEYDNIPYLIRWKILGQHIKVHKFLRSDTDCMHDHPWAFLSILIKGSYYEKTPMSPGSPWFKVKKYSSPCILYRPAKYIHNLSIDETKTVISIVINFKKVRSWGFWTKKGWIGWRTYKPTGGCDV